MTISQCERIALGKNQREALQRESAFHKGILGFITNSVVYSNIVNSTDKMLYPLQSKSLSISKITRDGGEKDIFCDGACIVPAAKLL